MIKKRYVYLFLLFVPLVVHSQEIQAPQNIISVSGDDPNIVPISSEIDRLEDEISSQNNKIQDIQKDIDKYNKELEEVGQTKSSLAKEVRELNLSLKKAALEVNKVNNDIHKANLKLTLLGDNLSNNFSDTEKLKNTYIKLIQRQNENEHQNIYYLLAHESYNFLDFIRKLHQTELLNNKISNTIKSLRLKGSNIKKDQSSVISQKKKLSILERELADRKTVIEIITNNQKVLLKETENEEDKYQELLKEKIDESTDLYRELYEYESALEFAIDPKTIPKERKGLLSWPAETSRITQSYGCTSFAKRSGIYSKCHHNGVDFGTKYGKILAAADGVIKTTESSYHSRCGYGKWVIINHNNGISSLYGHLSKFVVREGQSVKRGEIIGYSGNTGVSIAAHLHFSLFLTTGLKVVPYSNISSRSACRGFNVPVAPSGAELNPICYFPENRYQNKEGCFLD